MDYILDCDLTVEEILCDSSLNDFDNELASVEASVEVGELVNKLIDVPVNELVSVEANELIDVPVNELVSVEANELIDVPVNELVSVEASVEVGVEVSVEAGVEVGELVSVEVGELVSVEANELIDVPVNELVSVEVGVEVGVEVSVEASVEVGVEASVEVGELVSVEVGVEVDVPVNKLIYTNTQLNNLIDKHEHLLNLTLESKQHIGFICSSITDYENQYNTLNTRLDDSLITLNTRLDDSVTKLDSKLDDSVTRLDDSVTKLDSKLDDSVTRLDDSVTKLDSKLDDSVTRLDDSVTKLDSKLDDSVTRLDDSVTRLDDSLIKLDSKLDDSLIKLDSKLDDSVIKLDSKLDDSVIKLDSKLDDSVITLNTKLDDSLIKLDSKLDDSLITLNTRLDGSVTKLDSKFNGSLITLNTKLDDCITTSDLPKSCLSKLVFYNNDCINTQLINGKNALSINVDNVPIATFSHTGMSICNMLIAGVLHSDSNGIISTYLINGSDIASNANILNSSLARLTACDLIANSATSATHSLVANAIVCRDVNGDFTANVITANEFRGTFSNVLMTTGGTITGQLVANNLIANNITSAKKITFNIDDNEILDISASSVYIKGLDGIVSAINGTLTNRLIKSYDIEIGSIENKLLQCIKTPGLIADSATSATSALIPNTIVSRDANGNFSAGTITANLNGVASGCLSINGGTIYNSLLLPNGLVDNLSLTFTNNKQLGIYANDSLHLVNGVTGLSLLPNGEIRLKYKHGIMHSDTSGLLTSSLIVGADIAPNANIQNSCLETLTATGLIANSATSATPLLMPSCIVSRDTNGDFAAGTITASLNGVASGCLPLTGGKLTGDLISNKIVANQIVIRSQSGIVKSLNGTLYTSQVIDNVDTSATSSLVPNSIVCRDATGGFTSGTITGSFSGTLNGIATSCLALSGGVMSGSIVLPAGAAYNPSLRFAGATLSGLYSSANSINISISSVEVAQFDSSGVTIRTLSNGIVSAINGKLHTCNIVPNESTSATSLLRPNTIVSRDANGMFEFRPLLFHRYVIGDNIRLLEPYIGNLNRNVLTFSNLPLGIYCIKVVNLLLFIDHVLSTSDMVNEHIIKYTHNIITVKPIDTLANGYISFTCLASD